MIDNKKALKSLIWVENILSQDFNIRRGRKLYHNVLSNALIDMYKDFFIGKYFRSYGEFDIHQITGIVLRSMGLRFVLDDPDDSNHERYFFGSDSIFDDEY